MNKIYPKTYNYHYCKKELKRQEIRIKELKVNGKTTTTLILCKDCYK